MIWVGSFPSIKGRKFYVVTPMKTQATSYWTFFCNPAKWQIDAFLASGRKDDNYQIASWQSDWFSPGQLGVIRVGGDSRTLGQRDGKPRLQPGIYGIVEVIGTPREQPADDAHWLESTVSENKRQVVDIHYRMNLLRNPLLMEVLKSDPTITDKYLLGGFQASSMPLERPTFDRILALAGGEVNTFEGIVTEPSDTAAAIAALEARYAGASPQIKEVISRRIERGAVADKVKAANNYKCQICEAMGQNPKGFLKKSGLSYVEAHHVTFISQMVPGSLGPSNIITVCATHHRQLHYGEVELVAITVSEFEFRIDGSECRIPRTLNKPV
jgi:hypothetical protein